MPYIKKERRDDFLDCIVLSDKIESPGELNYVITSVVKSYLDRKGIKYDTINEVVGVLECAKLELYRRISSPYEDTKIKENGDVY